MESTVERSTIYLIKLTNKSGIPLIQHRRKCFVLGFIISLTSIRDLAVHLLTRAENSFKYILTYKMCQDHLELLSACIRGKNGSIIYSIIAVSLSEVQNYGVVYQPGQSKLPHYILLRKVYKNSFFFLVNYEFERLYIDFREM